MRWRGIFSGVLALGALQAVLSTDAAAERAGGLLYVVGYGVRAFLSPLVPAIPDLRDRPPNPEQPETPPPPPPGSNPPRTRPVVPTTPGTGNGGLNV